MTTTQEFRTQLSLSNNVERIAKALESDVHINIDHAHIDQIDHNHVEGKIHTHEDKW